MNIAEHILIVNKIVLTEHIVILFVPSANKYIFNVPCSVSLMCDLGTGWIHIDCV